MVAEAINTATAAGATAENILVRGDSAFCSGKVVAAVLKAGATFSFAIARSSTVDAAINSISPDAYVPVQYPGAVTDPDTGKLISDAQVAEIEYTAFADTRYETTAWLVVRRVLDTNTQDPLFPVWRHHPFFTNNTDPVDQADLTHRHHAICETVWSDLIDGPWAHQPSGSFAANAAWNILAAICHNLLRAPGTLTGTARYAVARGATLRTHLINIPARLARPQRRPVLHLPARQAPSRPLAHLVEDRLRHLSTQDCPHHKTTRRNTPKASRSAAPSKPDREPARQSHSQQTKINMTRPNDHTPAASTDRGLGQDRCSGQVAVAGASPRQVGPGHL